MREEIERGDAPLPTLAAARALAERAAERVLSARGADDFEWGTAKDRGAADAVRIEIAEMLDEIGADGR